MYLVYKIKQLCPSSYNTRTEMYAGGVACCLLVSHVEYMHRALY